LIVDLQNHAELSHNTGLTVADYAREARALGVAVAVTEHNRLGRLPAGENSYGVCRAVPEPAAGRIIAALDAVEVLNGRAPSRGPLG